MSRLRWVCSNQKKVLFLLCLISVIFICRIAVAATVIDLSASSSTYCNITVSGDYIITGSTTNTQVRVYGGITANITLQNVDINMDRGEWYANYYSRKCAFWIQEGSTAIVTLVGDNTLRGSYTRAGLEVHGNLVISSDSQGTLNAYAGKEGAAIGGASHHDAGSITINGGTINAYSGENNPRGSCIGSGSFSTGAEWGTSPNVNYPQNQGSITINGGIINAYCNSRESGAGIGGGFNHNSGTINITGGKITVFNEDGLSAGIGGGYAAAYNAITITGGDITTTSNWGAGIGTGGQAEYFRSGVVNGKILITGGSIHTSSKLGAGIGIGLWSTYDGQIEITGGYLTSSSTDGAGIGGGLIGQESISGTGIGSSNIRIRISGGYILANAFAGAGIGGGSGGSAYGGWYVNGLTVGGEGGIIEISGGHINATSQLSAGIGGGGGIGSDVQADLIGCGGQITISGGTVRATGGEDAPNDIGNGTGSSAVPNATNYVCITGGNVYCTRGNRITPRPRNIPGTGEGHYVDLSIQDRLPTISYGPTGQYGWKDVEAINGLYYLYLSISDKTIPFQYGNVVMKSDTDYTAYCYYSDDYFVDDATQYNQHLATASMCLALSAYGSNSPIRSIQSHNVRNLMIGMGFEQIKANEDYNSKPETDSIGVCIGAKRLGEYWLIAVAIRGGGYESEWAGNFTLGTDGLHQGFENARNRAYEYLCQYITTLHQGAISGKIKLWITGYSRAAATSNLLAGYINDVWVENAGGTVDIMRTGNPILIQKEDLFAYCFETPMGVYPDDAARNDRYNNIYNIVNPDDLVTKVAPSSLEFSRYGVDMVLPAQALTSEYRQWFGRMISIYLGMESTDTYDLDKFLHIRVTSLTTEESPGTIDSLPKLSLTSDNIPLNVYLDDLMVALKEEVVISRPYYVLHMQQLVRDLMVKLFTDDSGFIERIIDSMKKDALMCILAELIWIGKNVDDNFGDQTWQTAVNDITDALMFILAGADDATSKNTVADIAILLLRTSTLPDELTSGLWNVFINNSLPSGHYPEVCLAWMQSFDNYYTLNAHPRFTINGYRIARVNCPVEVTVRDAAGNVVAFISAAGDVTTADTTGIVALVDRDGSRTFYIPADMDYTLEIKAVGEGTVNYSVNEFSGETGRITKLESYVDVPVKPGDLLLGTLPAYPATDLETGITEGSSVQYTLTVNGSELTPAVLLTGAEAAAAYYYIDSKAENPAYGFVTGSGLRVLDSFALLEASAYDGHAFTGWYVGGTCVSTEKQYRFQVKGDITIVARFSSEMFSLAVAPANRGDIIPGTYMAAAGDVVTVTRTSSSRAPLLVNGKSVPSDTFSMPAYNITLSLFDPPRTGDVEYPWLYLAAIVVSLALLVLFFLRKPRR